MALWDRFKTGFTQWEEKTAGRVELALRSDRVLQPVGRVLTVTMKVKRVADRAIAGAWSSIGLPTRRDQERTLHAIHQLQSRLLDLEERLAEARPPPDRRD
jgi:hypothetical protein